MAHSLSAPVGDTKRITKPDPKKKNQKFKPVANKPEDVKLVQLMLVANGYTVPVDGKASSGLVKAIRSFQMAKVGYKKPDGIVDPGMETWAKGKGKFDAYIKQLEKVEWVEIKEGGKVKRISVKDYEAEMERTKRKVKAEADKLISWGDMYIGWVQEANNMRAGGEGLMMAMTAFAVDSWGGIEVPEGKYAHEARGAGMVVKALVGHTVPDWTKIQKELKRGYEALNKSTKIMNDWKAKEIKAASGCITTAEIVRDTSFAVFEVLATAKIMAAGKGKIGIVEAHMMAGGATEFLKSSGTEIGKHLVDPKADGIQSVSNIMYDTGFGILTGGIGGKAKVLVKSKAFTGVVTKAISPKLAKYFPTKMADKLVEKMLSSPAMQNMLENAAKEALNQVKTNILKGKMPTQKDLEVAAAKIFTVGLLNSGPAGKLMDGMKGTGKIAGDALTKKMGPEAMDKAVKAMQKTFGKDVMEKLGDKGVQEIMQNSVNAFRDKASEFGTTAVYDNFTAKQTAGDVQKNFRNGIITNAKLQAELERHMNAQLNNKLKALQGAK